MSDIDISSCFPSPRAARTIGSRINSSPLVATTDDPDDTPRPSGAANVSTSLRVSADSGAAPPKKFATSIDVSLTPRLAGNDGCAEYKLSKYGVRARDRI